MKENQNPKDEIALPQEQAAGKMNDLPKVGFLLSGEQGVCKVIPVGTILYVVDNGPAKHSVNDPEKFKPCVTQAKVTKVLFRSEAGDDCDVHMSDNYRFHNYKIVLASDKGTSLEGTEYDISLGEKIDEHGVSLLCEALADRMGERFYRYFEQAYHEFRTKTVPYAVGSIKPDYTVRLGDCMVFPENGFDVTKISDSNFRTVTNSHDEFSYALFKVEVFDKDAFTIVPHIVSFEVHCDESGQYVFIPDVYYNVTGYPVFLSVDDAKIAMAEANEEIKSKYCRTFD